jgi:serine/threonine protein kinase
MDAHASHELRPGALLDGKVQVLRRLAVGGMAELYLARARGAGGFEKLVVVKRVLPHLAQDPDFIDMFFREARLAATLDHPNVVHVMDIGAQDDDPYFVMEYVHGEDLRSILRKAAPRALALEHAVAIVDAAATGLHYVHERVGLDGRPLGLVHRDVSPSNILVTYEGAVKVADFGIVKAAARTQMTRAGMMKGKVGYMSPEQCRGDEIDRRSDVFALGILLYETTTGRRLFHGDNDYAVLHRIVSGRYMPLCFDEVDVPEALAAIVSRALQRDADARYPTAQGLSDDLQAFAREAGLRLSPQVIAECIRELFGARPYPRTDEEGLVGWEEEASSPRESERVVHELGIVPERSSARRAWITTGVVSSLAIAFGVAGFVRGTATTPNASEDSLEAREPVRVDEEPVEHDASSTASFEEVATTDDGSSETGSVPEATTTPGDASPVSPSRRGKPRKKTPRRRASGQATRPERSGQLDDLFPPSHGGR